MNAQKQNQAIQNVQRIQRLERELAKETAKVAALKHALEWCFRSLCAYLDYAPSELRGKCYDPNGAIESSRELLK